MTDVDNDVEMTDVDNDVEMTDVDNDVEMTDVDNDVEMTDFFDCYIRRDFNEWVNARNHHRQALEIFLNSPSSNNNEYVYVSVPHEDGGNFEVNFRRHPFQDRWVNQNVQSISNYTDDYGRNVEIIVANPNYIAYINRVVGIVG